MSSRLSFSGARHRSVTLQWAAGQPRRSSNFNSLDCDVACLLERLEAEAIAGQPKMTQSDSGGSIPKLPESGSTATRVTQRRVDFARVPYPSKWDWGGGARGHLEV